MAVTGAKRREWGELSITINNHPIPPFSTFSTSKEAHQARDGAKLKALARPFRPAFWAVIRKSSQNKLHGFVRTLGDIHSSKVVLLIMILKTQNQKQKWAENELSSNKPTSTWRSSLTLVGQTWYFSDVSFFYPFFQRCEMVLGHHPNIFNIKYHKYLQGIARMSWKIIKH